MITQKIEFLSLAKKIDFQIKRRMRDYSIFKINGILESRKRKSKTEIY